MVLCLDLGQGKHIIENPYQATHTPKVATPNPPQKKKKKLQKNTQSPKTKTPKPKKNSKNSQKRKLNTQKLPLQGLHKAQRFLRTKKLHQLLRQRRLRQPRPRQLLGSASRVCCGIEAPELGAVGLRDGNVWVFFLGETL